MDIKIKIQNIVVFLEFFAGAGLGLFFHWVLHYEEASYVIFGIGVLLSLATWLLREDLDHVRESLTEQYRHSHELTFAIAQINDPECQGKAQELVAGLGKTIALLRQGYIPLDETEFYLYGAKAADKAQKQIRAVDPLTQGWSSRGAVVNFYQSNLRARQRKVSVRRIFVLNREELQDQEAQKVLKTQLQDGIDVRIALRDELTSSGESTWASTCSFNFAVYDDRVVTDVFTHPGNYYGRKTKEPAEVAKYLRLLDLIEHNAHKVVCEQERIVLAGEVAVPETANFYKNETSPKKKTGASGDEKGKSSSPKGERDQSAKGRSTLTGITVAQPGMV
jgi:hypothetical protein